MDDCVKEYLLHRGLYASNKAVENELKTEKDKAFQVNIIKMDPLSWILLPVGSGEFVGRGRLFISVRVSRL